MDRFFIRLLDPDGNIITQGPCSSIEKIRRICSNFLRHYPVFTCYVYELTQEVNYGSSR